jgi:uncharacterized protein YbjQ (UPF0145 family)|tara:strand:- start:1403 stop:1729 length:327 start_codon:yes stop_codon:yes gene_type:complete
MTKLIMTTTPIIEGRPASEYLGIVSGETIIGTNIIKDFFAGVRDIIGSRSSSYESVLREAKESSLKEIEEKAIALGANAVVGVDLDYETMGPKGGMLMVPSSGTGVKI